MNWAKIWKQRATGWAYSEIPAAQTPTKESHALVTDDAYVYVWLESMRIANVRKGISRFFGTVHSFATLPVLGSGAKAEFHVVTSPTSLQSLDSEHLDRVKVLHQRLLGPIPWRGGVLSLQMGLFSIKEAELATPFVKLLETLSTAAGVSFVEAAMPFAEPIRKGIELIADANGDCLEIGLSLESHMPKVGTFALMRASASTTDTSKWSVDSSYRLMSNGSLVEGIPYLVYRIEAVRRREDWFAIPSVAKAYQNLNDSIAAAADEGRVTDLLWAFRRTVLTSPDLLFRDAQKLVGEIETRTAKILAAPKKVYRGKAGPPPLPPLDRIPLY